MDTTFSAPIAEQIWDMKYRLKRADGTIVDHTVQDTWRRIANALAEPEKPEVREHWAEQFYSALEDFKFLPAGRIVAGAGTGRNVTLSNCFTMGTIPDSMDGIFSHLKEAALTMQAGGGIGYDFSTIRPKGAHVKGVDADASGPLTFMDCWDAMCRTVMSAGSRRGAMMSTMRCDHPDIEDFITAKRDPLRLRMFNVSVLVTDAFMEAVEADAPWRLHFEDRHGNTLVERTVQARDLWNKIMESTYGYAEPGVIFIDRVNNMHNIWYLEKIATTNPCGEKGMGPYASCLLGSINLVKFVNENGVFRSNALVDTVKIAIRMMDNVIEAGKFPLEAQERKAKEDRQLGLGMTGLADALMMMGVRYGSDVAVDFTESLMKLINDTAYETSIELAKEKGPFLTFDADKFLESGFMKTMDAHIQAGVREYGIRNALLTSIAPTGTISLYAGNVSSGIEPVFAHAYTRKVLQPDGTKTEERVVDYAVAEWEKTHQGEPYPDYFVTAQDLSPMDHVRMQAAAQWWVDSSISKTVNVPEDISFEDFKEVYMEAYRSGCKGCTTYRPNDVTGSVLSVEPKKEEPENLIDKALRTTGITEWKGDEETLPERPDELHGTTYKIKVGDQKAVYLTINDMVEPDGSLRPFEIFLRSSDSTHDEWMQAISRMISAIMRRPHDSSFIGPELMQISSAVTGGFQKGKGYQGSLVAAIGAKIKEHTRGTRLVAGIRQTTIPSTPDVQLTSSKPCPKCNSYNTKNEGGCLTCLDCGNSKCG